MTEPEYVTEISVPVFGDDGIQRLRSRMREPEPLPEPTMADVWRAQDAVADADRAGCTAAEHDRLAGERRLAQAAYFEAYDRELLRAREAIPDEPEPEAGR